MGMVITNNTSALNTQRWLNMNNRSMSSSLEKLSSGYRINTAADDPAGLVISEKLRAQNAGLERAVQNTQEAMNVIGIAEGALNEMNSILSKMRELALHASNSGVTSADQIEADQAEMDSAIEAIDRIANTTKYSDEFLLNGSKSLTYDDNTTVTNTLDERLLDLGLTKVNQISSTADYSVNISFAGANATETTADMTTAAQRAYLEATSATTGAGFDKTTNALTQDISFVVTGKGGSESFSFTTGTSLGEIAKTIDDLADSTGVGAQLVFDSTVSGTAQTGATALAATGNAHASAEALVYNFDTSGNLVANGTGITGLNAVAGAVVGKNTDADGNIYVKWISATEYEAYKDAGMTMLVGSGAVGTTDMSQANDSGLTVRITSVSGMSAGMTSVISAGPALELDTSGATSDTGITSSGLASYINDNSAISGIRLGENTDQDGNIYVKIETSASGASTKVYLYNDSNMSSDSLVCESVTTSVAADNVISLFDTDTGLNMQLNMESTALVAAGAGGGTFTGTISTNNLGLRLYSTDYGDSSYVKVQAQEGALFTDGSGELLDAGESGAEAVDYGQNAVVTVNGQKVELNGTAGTVSTGSMNADLVFDEGELGATTIAISGYSDGALASKVGQMVATGNYATMALNNTTETLDNFQGGMQFQLGEGSGDQERTIYSIESMATSNMGQVKFTDDFDGDGTEETKMLSVDDLLGGGYASLAEDPVKALEIIDAAIDDVSSLRARLGATQSNLLQTNANSLNVAIENITATESAIRDVDMATETTEFTKNQILVQSATAMLAQANTMSQNVLQLLG